MAKTMDWPGAIVGQDTVIQKPPKLSTDGKHEKGTAVGYHYDATYINDNFQLPDGSDR